MSGSPQLVVLSGRRRVGKTFLLSHFATGKPAVFHAATRQGTAVELERLHESARRTLGDDVLALTGGSFAGWEAALRFFAAVTRDQPLLVVLDEVTYLSDGAPAFASVLQSVWDHLGSGTRLMIVLAGSAVRYMESLQAGGGALHGRPTVRLRMRPVDLWQAQAFLPDAEPTQLIEAYAACGGYPLHLQAWTTGDSTWDNLQRLAGEPGGLLLEDATGILNEELPGAGGYSRILAAVGRGRTRFSEIATEAGQRIEGPLDLLVQAGFVEREVPIGATRRARPLYRVADPYLGFWFAMLYADRGLIEGGQGRAVLDRLAPRWRGHVSNVFEGLARQHAIRLVTRGELPNAVVGRWWTSTGLPCEIDVVGLSGTTAVLVGEAKWRKRAVGARVVAELLAKRERLPDAADDPVVAIWASGGVTDSARESGAVGFDARALVDG
ncbi:MAG: ATP-binding protein [Actinobacteria bacterium]|nr:ATP-binding protein [Actinomycetota bacterium]